MFLRLVRLCVIMIQELDLIISSTEKCWLHLNFLPGEHQQPWGVFRASPASQPPVPSTWNPGEPEPPTSESPWERWRDACRDSLRTWSQSIGSSWREWLCGPGGGCDDDLQSEQAPPPPPLLPHRPASRPQRSRWRGRAGSLSQCSSHAPPTRDEPSPLNWDWDHCYCSYWELGDVGMTLRMRGSSDSASGPDDPSDWDYGSHLLRRRSRLRHYLKRGAGAGAELSSHVGGGGGRRWWSFDGGSLVWGGEVVAVEGPFQDLSSSVDSSSGCYYSSHPHQTQEPKTKTMGGGELMGERLTKGLRKPLSIIN